jgi:ABC-type transport system involved in cytochrome bd biosynthesis fused ATPase/permease subunit
MFSLICMKDVHARQSQSIRILFRVCDCFGWIFSYVLLVTSASLCFDCRSCFVFYTYAFLFLVILSFFSLAPGKQASMEKAPWKLNKEMVDVMGGQSSELFQQYKQRCIQAFTAARKHAKEAITMLEIMQFHSNFPAFR